MEHLLGDRIYELIVRGFGVCVLTRTSNCWHRFSVCETSRFLEFYMIDIHRVRYQVDVVRAPILGEDKVLTSRELRI